MTIFYIATGWVDNYPNHDEKSPYSAWGAKGGEFPTLVDFGEKESETNASLVSFPRGACTRQIPLQYVRVYSRREEGSA